MTAFRTAAGGLLLLLGSLLPSVASADVPPPDLCDSVGQPCMAEGRVGLCEEATCSRIDYASWDRDAPGGPPMVEYPCNRCSPGSEGEAGVGALGLVVGGVCCLVVLGGLLVGVVLMMRRRKKE